MDALFYLMLSPLIVLPAILLFLAVKTKSAKYSVLVTAVFIIYFMAILRVVLISSMSHEGTAQYWSEVKDMLLFLVISLVLIFSAFAIILKRT